jgi:hypothetical protein
VKLTVLLLLALGGTAAGENLTLSAVPASAEPNIAGSAAVCKDGDRLRLVSRMKLDGHEVQLLRECDGDHEKLAFETKDGWREFDSGAIGGSEQTTFSTLKKRRMLMHRIDTRDGDTSHSRVDLCGYDKSGAPQCGTASVECPETGCQEPTILKGALWLHAKGGRQRFPIKP